MNTLSISNGSSNKPNGVQMSLLPRPLNDMRFQLATAAFDALRYIFDGIEMVGPCNDAHWRDPVEMGLPLHYRRELCNCLGYCLTPWKNAVSSIGAGMGCIRKYICSIPSLVYSTLKTFYLWSWFWARPMIIQQLTCTHHRTYCSSITWVQSAAGKRSASRPLPFCQKATKGQFNPGLRKSFRIHMLQGCAAGTRAISGNTITVLLVANVMKFVAKFFLTIFHHW